MSHVSHVTIQVRLSVLISTGMVMQAWPNSVRLWTLSTGRLLHILYSLLGKIQHMTTDTYTVVEQCDLPGRSSPLRQTPEQPVCTHASWKEKKKKDTANTNSANIITFIHWRLPFVATAKNVATTASPYALIWKYTNQTKHIPVLEEPTRYYQRLKVVLAPSWSVLPMLRVNLL